MNVPPHDNTNKMDCALSEDSEQPGLPPSLGLIRVFAVRFIGSFSINMILKKNVHKFVTTGACANPRTYTNEPAHEIMALFVLLKLIQPRMRSHPVGLDVWFCSDPSSTSIFYVCEQRKLWWDRGCAGSPESSLIAYAISTIISWAGSNMSVWTVALYLLHCERILLS